jgi:D-apionolactonase
VNDAPFDAAPDADPARLVHGGDEPLPERLAVRAGPLSLVIEAGDVRHVHVGEREVVRRIYGAVRDHAWRTIPARLSGFTLDRGADTFRCRYHAGHRQDAVAFGWDATIEGAADGTLTFAFDGVAEATFERNRIGLCLLHPLPALSGARVRVTTSAGAHRLLAFPDLVAVEQPIAGFDDIATLAVEIGADLWLEAAVEGDVFQAEDQRNWIDASTKIYSTPVTLPKPVTVPRGTRITQRVTLRLRTARGDAARSMPVPCVVDRADGGLRFGDGRTGRLPAIGVRAAGAVRHAKPAHRRIDLDLAGDAAPATLAAHRAAARQATVSPPLELALHVPDDAGAAARALARIDLDGLEIARVLAFTIGHDTTQSATLDAVRAWRAPHAAHASVSIATGTASDLARIHLAPAPLVAADAVCWAMHPQAHATDLTTIAESPDGARDQVRTVKQRMPGRPIAITATFGRQGQADPRAGSLFAAGWTLALLAALGEGGADSVTLAEAWPEGDDLAALPVMHVLAALAAERDATLRPVTSTLDTVRAVALERDARCTLFVANLAPRDSDLALPPAPGGWTAWVLDADTPLAGGAATALIDRDAVIVASGRLSLGACAIARLEAALR